MKRVKTEILACLLLSVIWCVGGCGDKFWDPTQVGRFRPTPAVNVILDSLGVAEEAPVAWEQADEPRPNDIIAVPTDYTLRSGDIVRVAIFELFQAGAAVVNDYVVTETGKISIPDVGVIQAAGLTETQLEDEIRQILSPGVLKEPMVNASLLASQQRTFSVLGDGVPAPGRYVIPRYDFRLTDALATAGGPRQFNVSYIFVTRFVGDNRKGGEVAVPQIRGSEIRELQTVEPQTSLGQSKREIQPPQSRQPNPALRGIPEPKEPTGRYQSEREMLQMGSPSVQNRWPTTYKVAAASGQASGYRQSAGGGPKGFQPLTPRSQTNTYAKQVVQSPAEFGGLKQESAPDTVSTDEPRIEWLFQDGKWVPVQVTPMQATESWAAIGSRDAGIEWTFKDGKWVPVQTGPTVSQKPAVRLETDARVLPLEDEKVLPMELEWDQAVHTRLIKIPADRLLAGDPRYNIVIKPGDTIHVPVDIIGEFCIMGNINNSGFINITGRPMTLKMAIAAAGGLGPLAWPKSCEVVRRIGEKKEEVVMVDLDKIANGEQPDFFIKPNDLINVGTHPTSRWRAILRNAFRAAYGFGFVYDRNFADADYGKGFRLPGWL